MNAKTLRLLSKGQDEVFKDLVERWWKSDRRDPVRSLEMQRKPWVMWICLALFVVGCGVALHPGLHPDVVKGSRLFIIIWSVLWGFTFSTIYMVWLRHGWQSLFHAGVDPCSSAGTFMRTVTLLESKLGPLSAHNEGWKSPQRRSDAARWVAFNMAERVMNLQRDEDPDAGFQRKVMILTLGHLKILTGVSTDFDTYFSRQNIENARHEENAAREMRASEGKLADGFI